MTSSAPEIRQPGMLAVAVPTLASSLIYSCVGFASIKAVAGLGVDSVAAVLAAERVLLLVNAGLAVVVGPTAALIAQLWGAGRQPEAAGALRLLIWLVSGLGLGLTLVTWLAAPALVGLFGLSTAAQVSAVLFLRITSAFNVLAGIAQVLTAAQRATGDATTPLWAFGIANLVNILMLATLVQGWGPIPGLGVAGAAWANGVAYALAAALLYASLQLRGSALRSGGSIDPTQVAKVFRIGLPASAQQILVYFGLFIMMLLVARFGAAAAAAYGLAMNVVSFAFIVGSACATAAATLVGQRIGAGDDAGARRDAWRAAGYATVAMTVLGAVAAVFAGPIGRFADMPASAISPLTTFLVVLAICQPFMALEFALSGSLRGAGATRPIMFISLVGLIGRLSCATGFYLGGLDVRWVFAALLVDYGVKSALYVRVVLGAGWTRPVI
ncbi:MATE family efflux transporter [Phenylobacterium sp.]|jgi:putative MATE family efflux protein|uniref:MATE family efflux transporter n=2 Tax=Phenylobacterium sp. TaxID=1871053 RepID=UPI002600BD72|nr:MATE family efflux transporter [Phenylobacterium sp.]